MLETRLAIRYAALVCALAWSAGSVAAERSVGSGDGVRRVPWTGSRVTGRPEPPPPYALERIHPGAVFKDTTLIDYQAGLGRFFVGERSGKIHALPRDRSGKEATLFFDAADVVERLNRGRAAGEQVVFDSLYGMVFDPEFATNRQCFVCYVVKKKGFSGKLGPGGDQLQDGTRVVRLRVRETDPPRCDPDSEQLVISWPQGGHNGGCLRFGPDGCLYVSTGDGSNVFPPDANRAGQDLSTLLSKVLRIDVRGGTADRPYTIPADNPFVEVDKARGETWAYGLRNPWKMSFDRSTGELWVGDVGWELWELVFNVQRGANYGWSIVEGPQQVNVDWPRGPTPIVPATMEIPHTEGASITGGFVYRGRKFPELVGNYVFGDWETRRIWAAKVAEGRLEARRELVDPVVRIVDFAEDAEGELYLLDHDDGAIYTLARNESAGAVTAFPDTLAATGLFSSVADHLPAPGVVPFEVNAEQWSDHATAERLVAVPASGSVAVRERPIPVPGSQFRRAAVFPRDSVLVKTLSLEMVAGNPATRRRVETQLLHFDGREWLGYTYEWNEAQSDAVLVDRGGKERVFEIADAAAPGGRREQTWRFSSRAECLRCHNPWSGYALAFNLPQLNRTGTFGGVAANQITALASIGLLVDDPTPDPDDPYARLDVLSDPARLPRLADVFDPREPVDARARSYLHVNCGHCHRFNGGGSARIYLSAETKLRDTLAVGASPTQGTFGIENAEIIAAGDPCRSVLYFRLAKSGPGHMPHLGAREVDDRGLALIHDWIGQIPARFSDAVRVERLGEIDEPFAVEQEREKRPTLEWRAARDSARRAQRPEPDERDIAAAREAIDRRFAAEAASREEERPRLVRELLAGPASAQVLVDALRRGRLPPGIRRLALETVAASGVDPAIHDLFEPYLPQDSRIRRLGDSFDTAALLAMPGDPARGEQLFHASTVVQCRNCHRVGDRGQAVGPPLDAIGRKYDRAKLLEAIVHPSLQIEPRYANWLAQTTKGTAVTGLLEERSDEVIVLRDVRNVLHRIPADEVEELLPQSKSLMPEQQLRDFTAEQAADLLAYLASLKDAPPGE